MKKFSLLVGATVGFVLGSRAGREPYDKLEAKVKKTLNRGDVQQTLDQATHTATEQVSVAAAKVEEKLPGATTLPGDTTKAADSQNGSDVGDYP
jgi:hypothetical protein